MRRQPWPIRYLDCVYPCQPKKGREKPALWQFESDQIRRALNVGWFKLQTGTKTKKMKSRKGEKHRAEKRSSCHLCSKREQHCQRLIGPRPSAILLPQRLHSLDHRHVLSCLAGDFNWWWLSFVLFSEKWVPKHLVQQSHLGAWRS